jgi:AcrR family transcriptional regulator
MAQTEERPRLRKEGGRYHHGNLKDALVLAAERSLARTGRLDLPLRDVAKIAGVSHAAAYRHFASKAALMAELAIRGFHHLTTQVIEATRQSASAEVRLEQAAVAYLDFAMESKGAFRVMFEASLRPFSQFEGLAEAAQGALSVLEGIIGDGVREGAFEADDLHVSVMAAWSLVHGHAILVLDEQVGISCGGLRVEAHDSMRRSIRRLIVGLKRNDAPKVSMAEHTAPCRSKRPD